MTSARDAIEARQLEEKSLLPEDGQLISVTRWRHEVVQGCMAVMALMMLAASVEGFLLGSLAGVSLGIFLVALAVASVRLGMCGMMVEKQGIKVRTPLMTRRWRWDEIGRFELKERGPRLRLQLRNGQVKKIRGGFCAQSRPEEERLQALFAALQNRLAVEQFSRG